MTPEEALNILNQVTGAIQTDRRSHGQIQMALAVFQKLIEDSQPAPTAQDEAATDKAAA